MLTRQGQAPGENASLAGAADAAADLLQSRAVAESAAQNLKLDAPASELLDRIDVETGTRSALLRLSVNARDREDARRSAQEVAQVFTVLYNNRFGPAVKASIWEGARARDDPVSPRPALNLALGALIGAAVGIALAALRRPVRRPSLDARVAVVTARERALAGRAAELSPRERRAPPPRPVPAGQEFVRPERGEWTLADVELLVARHGSAFPQRSEELGTYLESIRSVAEPDGRLPAGVEIVVEDVFADLIERARLVGSGSAE